MALDRGDIEFIEAQNAKIEKRITEAINGQGSGIRAKIEAEINRIDEMDMLRNGRIQKSEDEICELQRETRVFRFAQRNPKISILIFFILTFCSAWGYHTISVKRTVEKMLKIEMKDHEDD